MKLIAACVVAATLVGGCGGGGATVKTTTTTVSVGQQLIDLKNALDRGAITKDQYKKAKEDLIKRTTNS